jgi:hypothetical protein
MKNRASSITNRPVHEYEAGTYEDLNRRNLRKGDLEMYHLIAPNIAATFIPGYNQMEAACIALRRAKHYRLLTASQTLPVFPAFNYNSKVALAYVIGRNIEPKSIPTPVFHEALYLHCEKFPRIYVKPNQQMLTEKPNTTNCDAKELAIHIPYIHSRFLGELEDILVYGNCVEDLPVAIYHFLSEKRSLCQPGTRNNEDMAGQYVVHREINSFSGKPRSLTIHIEADGSETREENSSDYIRTTKTFNFKVSLSYQ